MLADSDDVRHQHRVGFCSAKPVLNKRLARNRKTLEQKIVNLITGFGSKYLLLFSSILRVEFS